MQTQLKIRLPAHLKGWLKERADANHRKMNGELVVILEAAKSQAYWNAEQEKLFRELEATLGTSSNEP